MGEASAYLLEIVISVHQDSGPENIWRHVECKKILEMIKSRRTDVSSPRNVSKVDPSL